MTDERKLTLDDIPDVLTLVEAADAVRSSALVLRQAIKAGKLKAFIPGGRSALRPGRGQGYRIHKADLQSWWFGEERT